MDFSLATSRLERNQKKSREDAKRKLQEERMAQHRQKAREEEAARQRADKIERDRIAAEEEQQRKEREVALTGGISFEQIYLATCNDELEEDKIVLPESALGTLNSQDAFSNGVMLFTISRLDAEGNVLSTTHCGVREFSAPEGTVVLSRKVINSLNTVEEADIRLDPASFSMKVQIKYIRMNKLTYVKLRPIDNRFSTIVPIKNMLTENLIKHATLTKGDMLSVWYRGEEHRLRVIETKPEDHGSLIETDLEVDLDVSEEYSRKSEEEQSIKKQELGGSNTSSGRNNDHFSSMETGKGYSLGSSVVPPPQVPSSICSSRREYDLGVEPLQDAQGVITCKIKTPSGQLLSRRFLREDKFENLFFYSSERLAEAGVQDGQPERITLATRYPSKVYTMSETHGGKTFEDIGITERQQMFLLSVV